MVNNRQYQLLSDISSLILSIRDCPLGKKSKRKLRALKSRYKVFYSNLPLIRRKAIFISYKDLKKVTRVFHTRILDDRLEHVICFPNRPGKSTEGTYIESHDGIYITTDDDFLQVYLQECIQKF